MLSPLWRWCLRRLLLHRARPAQRRRPRADLEELESRLAPASYAVSAQLEICRLDSSRDASAARHVVFCESAVTDFETLSDGLGSATDFVVLDSAGDGLREMAAFLQSRHEVSSIGIVAHGAAGAVSLGTVTLTGQNVAGPGRVRRGIGARCAPGGGVDVGTW